MSIENKIVKIKSRIKYAKLIEESATYKVPPPSHIESRLRFPEYYLQDMCFMVQQLEQTKKALELACRYSYIRGIEGYFKLDMKYWIDRSEVEK